ncbi:hypothetical protein [Pedobacter kyonggii]|uniref:Uncharacterized protein n=1 Tax=Pedobacter kyonggii TaxID=1926871 RepID=A0A4V2JGV0_9SPHI|nr:hypothetical protein [Pedobacter kyonggii]TBO42247.1 hypothetical protein EYS08_12035 [Pedobacter kyonggii]
MKKYVKGIKLFSLIVIIIMGTVYFIRKADALDINIKTSVKNSLEVDRGYISIGNSKLRNMTRKEAKTFETLFHSTLTKKYSKAQILITDHRCRIKDTLYTMPVYVSMENEVLAIGEKLKVK